MKSVRFMKLKTLKIEQFNVTPKMLIAFIGALFILGIGIGATVASPNTSKFALFICLIVCLIVSITIVLYTFLKIKKLNS